MTEPVRPDRQQETAAESLSASGFAGAGIQLAVALVVFVLAGNWLDNRLGTSPIFVLVGVFIGGGATFFSFYRRISSAQRLDDAERRKRTGKQ